MNCGRTGSGRQARRPGGLQADGQAQVGAGRAVEGAAPFVFSNAPSPTSWLARVLCMSRPDEESLSGLSAANETRSSGPCELLRLGAGRAGRTHFCGGYVPITHRSVGSQGSPEWRARQERPPCARGPHARNSFAPTSQPACRERLYGCGCSSRGGGEAMTASCRASSGARPSMAPGVGHRACSRGVLGAAAPRLVARIARTSDGCSYL